MSEASPWGMTIHYPNEHLIDLLNRGGVSWIRFGVPWSFVPPTGTPNWAAYGGTVMNAVRKRGMFVYLGLDVAKEPLWLYDEKTIPIAQRAAAREESYTRFVTTALNYFGANGVRTIHIGNEPNDAAFYPFGEAAYFDRLVRAIRIIRQNDGGRGFKVAAPDLATGQPSADAFLQRCINNMRQNNVMIDVLSLHGYVPTTGSAIDLMLPLAQYTPLMAQLNLASIPIWLTETGVNMTADVANNPKDITDVCNYVRNGFRYLQAGRLSEIYLKKVFWFVWSEQDDDKTPGVEGKYSWLTTDLVPRPREWAAYTAAIGEPRPPVQPEYDATITGANISIRPGETRAIVFHVTNTGRLSWDAGVRFENVDFGRQGAPALTPRSVAIPAPLPWLPQQSRDISIPVTGPDVPGAVFRLRLQFTIGGTASQPGEQFGGRVVINVSVPVSPTDQR